MSISIIGSRPVTVTENGTERELFYNTGSSGGSQTTVVANPTGEATDGLEKLQIGDTIYSVAGEGGGFILATSTMVEQNVVLNIKPSDIFDNNNNVGKIVLLTITNEGSTTCAMGVWYTTNGSDDSQIKFYTGSGVDVYFTSSDFNNEYFTMVM